jgi:Protein of unknown function (DUF2752)
MAAGELESMIPQVEAMDHGTALAARRRSLSREGELIAGGTFILVAAFLYPYAQGFIDRVTPGCLLHRVTGIPCLLCGMTRSMAATAHGRLAEAFRLHLLGPPLFAVLLLGILALVIEKSIGRPILPRPDERQRRYVAWGVLGLLIGAYVARLVFFGVNV